MRIIERLNDTGAQHRSLSSEIHVHIVNFSIRSVLQQVLFCENWADRKDRLGVERESRRSADLRERSSESIISSKGRKSHASAKRADLILKKIRPGLSVDRWLMAVSYRL
jgi:hypothetical protein